MFAEKGEIEGKENEKWHSYPSVGRTGSTIPTASDVSVDEIRSAATGSDRYPASLHAPLMSSPEPPPYIPGTVYVKCLRILSSLHHVCVSTSMIILYCHSRYVSAL